MKFAEELLSALLTWIRSFGMGGAFFLVTLGVLAVCGLALWVMLAALTQAPR